MEVFANKMWKRRAVDYLIKIIDSMGTAARKKKGTKDGRVMLSKDKEGVL